MTEPNKGTLLLVKHHLRKGETLTRACYLAGYSKDKLYHRRQLNSNLDDEIKRLMRNRKPKRASHINVTGRGIKQAQGAAEYWEKWDAAAKAGKLRSVFGLKVDPVRPPNRRLIVTNYPGRNVEVIV